MPQTQQPEKESRQTEKAARILEKAKADLASLVTETLVKDRWGEADLLVDLVRGVSRLKEDLSSKVRTEEARSKSEDAGEEKASSSRRTAGRKSARRGASAGKYPRFRRDGDKLVKVAWSKKARSEYEHRATNEALFAFVEHLRKQVEPGKTFKVENLGSVSDRDDNEVPGYQIYLVLKWLQSVNVMVKRGRDGYLYREGDLSEACLHKHWKSLPTE